MDYRLRVIDMKDMAFKRQIICKSTNNNAFFVFLQILKKQVSVLIYWNSAIKR